VNNTILTRLGKLLEEGALPAHSNADTIRRTSRMEWGVRKGITPGVSKSKREVTPALLTKSGQTDRGDLIFV